MGWTSESERVSYGRFLIFLMKTGIKKEKTNKPMEKKNLKESNWLHRPPDNASLRVPTKKAKINVPTSMPKPVPKK